MARQIVLFFSNNNGYKKINLISEMVVFTSTYNHFDQNFFVIVQVN